MRENGESGEDRDSSPVQVRRSLSRTMDVVDLSSITSLSKYTSLVGLRLGPTCFQVSGDKVGMLRNNGLINRRPLLRKSAEKSSAELEFVAQVAHDSDQAKLRLHANGYLSKSLSSYTRYIKTGSIKGLCYIPQQFIKLSHFRSSSVKCLPLSQCGRDPKLQTRLGFPGIHQS